MVIENTSFRSRTWSYSVFILVRNENVQSSVKQKSKEVLSPKSKGILLNVSLSLNRNLTSQRNPEKSVVLLASLKEIQKKTELKEMCGSIVCFTNKIWWITHYKPVLISKEVNRWNVFFSLNRKITSEKTQGDVTTWYCVMVWRNRKHIFCLKNNL